MLLLVSLIIIRTMFVLPSNVYFSIRIYLYLYFIILLFGFLSIYVLKDKKK